jgi:hypothetical protein
MAVGTHFDLQILTDGRTRLELVSAGARDRDLFVFGMDAGFHGNLIVMCGRIEALSLKKRQRHALGPYLLAKSYDFNDQKPGRA